MNLFGYLGEVQQPVKTIETLSLYKVDVKANVLASRHEHKHSFGVTFVST